MNHDHKRGKINDNALKALLTSPMFKTQKHKNKKLSYKRNDKHKNPSIVKIATEGFFVRPPQNFRPL